MAITWRRLSAARLRRTGADVGECGVKPRCCLARPALAVGVAGGGAPTIRLHPTPYNPIQLHPTCSLRHVSIQHIHRQTTQDHNLPRQAHSHVQSRALHASSPKQPTSPSRHHQGPLTAFLALPQHLPCKRPRSPEPQGPTRAVVRVHQVYTLPKFVEPFTGARVLNRHNRSFLAFDRRLAASYASR
jgi:hypothetical protein